MTTMARRIALVWIAAAAIMLESCHDGLLHAPAPQAPAIVTMRASISRAAGGSSQAYDRADRLFVRFRAGDDVRVEQTIPFAPSAAQTAVSVDIPLRQLTETMTAEVELRIGDRALFRGSAAPTLAAGVSTPVDFTLAPVVAAVNCGTGTIQLSAYGQTVQLSGAALFATGDTVPDMPVTWSASASTAVSVGEKGDVTALQDGDAVATCAASGLTATRAVHVFGVVRSVQVAPASATLVIGSTLTHVATLFDSLGNIIASPRPLAWSSASSGVATVNSTGVVTAVSSGTARIDATSGTAVGSATLIVVSPSTAVTIASTALTGTSAILIGSVNPRGADTQSWFEWGTDQSLAGAAVTPSRSMGGGAADVSITEPISGLVPNTTYYFRVVANSAGGTTRGATFSFTTPRPPTVATVGADPTTTQIYVVRGSATPNGSATTAYFEYGTSPTLSSSTQSTRQSIGSGQTAVVVTQSLSALQPSTTYFVRIVATNIGGTSVGTTVSFRTSGPPIIGAEGGQIPPNTCQTIQGGGEANPNGATTEGWFEYGSTPGLTTFISTPHVNLGSGTSTVHFDITFGGSGTVYFRIAASNVWGTARHPTILSLSPSGCIR
jgi:hypothetical protein